MKKWMYVISVGSMLTIFLVFYVSETRKREEKEKARMEQAARNEAEKKQKQKEIENKARADAEKRAADAAAAAAAKEAERLAKWEAVGRDIQEATAKHNADADRYAKRSAELELQLGDLRAQKEKLNREVFELAKQVELGKINRRTAELEIQRIVAMIANKASQSSLANAH